jgi:WD40 repeat protein
LSGGIAIYHSNPFQPADPIVVRSAGFMPQQRIAFSPDAHTLAASSDTLQLWNVDTGAVIRTIPIGTTRALDSYALVFSPDGHRVATGRSDGALQLWDAETGAQLGQTLSGHTSVVTGIAYAADGGQIASVSRDGTLRTWNATVGQSMKGPDPNIGSVTFSPDGQRVAASGDTAVEQWDVTSGRPLPPLTGGGVGGHSFSYVDGGRIVSAALDGTVQVWDVSNGQAAGPAVHIATGPDIFISAFRRDGHVVASGSERDGTIRLWDVATGQPIGQSMTHEPGTPLLGLAFSPDGHRLMAGYYDGGLRLYNADTTQLDGAPLAEAGPMNPVGGIAFSTDGATVAVGRSDGNVELWDAQTRKQLPHSPLRGHTGALSSVDFGAAHQLATGAADGTLRLWDTATGRPAAAAVGGYGSVDSVAISPDGRLVAAASIYDGTVRLAPAASDAAQLCDKLSTNMSRKQWRDWVSPGIRYIKVCTGLPVAPD